MASPPRGMFREKSLERLSSPERLDMLLRVADRRSWLPLGTLGLLVGLLVLWSFVGEIPVYVQGRGILIRPRQITSIHAPGEGYLASLDVGVDQQVRRGEVIGLIARPDLDARLRLQRDRAEELSRDGDDLEAHRELALQLRRRELGAIADERESLTEQRELALSMPAHLESQWESQQELYRSGVISHEALVRAEEAYMDSLARISKFEAQLRELRTRELTIEDETLLRMQRLADREQEVAGVDREIERLEAALAQETRIVADRDGRILELVVAVGEFVAAGARLGKMDAVGESTDLEGVAYFSVGDGKRLDPGTPVQITPDTVERERHGSLVATIHSVSPFSVSRDEIESMVGSPEIAQELIAAGYLIQARAHLEADPTTTSGLRWTSRAGAETNFTSGTTTTVRALIEGRAPISYVLPFFRESAGID